MAFLHKLIHSDGNLGIIPTAICNTNTILYAECPTSVTISPSSPYTAGQTVTCSSDGYPDVTIEWTDGTGGQVSPTATVTIPSGSFTYTCTATGPLDGVCEAAESISVTGKYLFLIVYTACPAT